jgi:hypothetical protein
MQGFTSKVRVLRIFFFIFIFCSEVLATQLQEDELSVAKKSQNVGALQTSVPFQLDFNGNNAPYDRTQLQLNFQPIFPVPFSQNLALITRWIVPVISQPSNVNPTGSTFGIGDVNPQLFLTIRTEGGFTWGAGTALVLPTATDIPLGQGKFSLGPALLAAYTGNEFVGGLLFTAVSSVAGDASRPAVGLMTLQPFINYNLPVGEYLISQPQIFREWKMNEWTVPLGGGFGKVYQFGETPVNMNFQGYYNVVSPNSGPDWQARFVMQFVYPQKRVDRKHSQTEK